MDDHKAIINIFWLKLNSINPLTASDSTASICFDCIIRLDINVLERVIVIVGDI